MIREINKRHVNKVYPQIDLKLISNEKFTINTSIRIKEENDNYLILLKRFIKFDDTINHKDLMTFVDSFMIAVNKVRKKFKLEDYKINSRICYKIIE